MFAEAFSFGTGSHGQLGLGKDVQQTAAPMRITALDDEGDAVAFVGAGFNHSLFGMKSGTATYC